MRTVLRAGLLILLSGMTAGAAEPVVGWRTDATGLYPSAAPTLEWSSDKNVVWKTPMASWSNASPVIVGDRIFVCSEPFDLVCVSKTDGKVLWTRGHDYPEVMTAEDKAQAEKDKVAADKIRKEEIGPLQQKLRDAQGELRKSPQDAALKQKASELNKQLDQATRKLAAVTQWERPGTHQVNGYSSQTPVSDGRIVAVLFGNGVAACYDLEGNRKWARFIEKTPHLTWGHSASPILAGGKLIVHMKNLIALDPATGKEVWRIEGSTHHWGTPVVARIGSLDAVITELGDVVNAADGKLLVKRLCALTYNAPIVHDDVAYFVQTNGKAVKLSAKGEGELDAKPLWTTRPKNDRYYASPVLHDKLIYAITQASHFSVIDPADGNVVAEKALDLGKGTVYPSLAIAGKHLFVSNDNGTTVVLEPGREFKQVARNTLGETFRSCPVFQGSRMYVRAYKHLYCIGE